MGWLAACHLKTATRRDPVVPVIRCEMVVASVSCSHTVRTGVSCSAEAGYAWRVN